MPLLCVEKKEGASDQSDINDKKQQSKEYHSEYSVDSDSVSW